MLIHPNLSTTHDRSARGGRQPRQMTFVLEPATDRSRGRAVIAGRFDGVWLVTAHDDVWGSFPLGRFARLRDAGPAIGAHRWNA